MKKIKNLLIVDDDNLFVFLTQKAIKQADLIENIIVFNNGLDALDFFKENIHNAEVLPEIMFLDLSMPILDGWQFLDEFERIMPEMKRKVKIYIVSSSISPDDITKAKNVSAVSDFLIKPITCEKLIELVKKMDNK